MEDGGDEDDQEEKVGNHYVPNVGLDDAHLPEAGPKALKLVISMGQTTCV